MATATLLTTPCILTPKVKTGQLQSSILPPNNMENKLLHAKCRIEKTCNKGGLFDKSRRGIPITAQPKAKKQFQVKVPEPYKFIRTLGQGRFGSVHEVLKTGSDEHFAMKVLPFTSEADFNKNEHEISKLQKNQHKNVVGFVEAIEGDTAHFVVLELSSCSLADRMSEVRKLGTLMDRVKVFRIVQDVLAGLGFLHSRNEVYGDVKPSNILIGVDGTAKLGDFGGVAGVGTQKTWNAAECGTMQFWGPEMFVLGGNVGSVSQAGDMWAFGLIVLELLTGKAWISGQNAVEIAESVKRFDVQAVCRQATIPNTVEPLLCFLLSKNPLERLSSAELIRSGRLQKDQIQHIVEDQSKTIALQKELLADVPIWVGTKSLQTLDRTVHSLTPTTLTQLFRFERQCRTAFTRPIDMGEWELKIKASKNTFVNMSLGFVRYPLPENATQRSCGGWVDGIGGDFILWNGAMLKSGKFKPPGTNKKWERGGQTAAIRVNMWTREARLFVDDEEQPGIFPDIPSPLCLAITTGFDEDNDSVEVKWLKRLRGNDELEIAALEERRTLKSENEIMKQQLAALPIWIGTESLQTLDRTVHTLTPTTLTQIIVTPTDNPWRTAFTFPIDEGEWELKIRATDNPLVHVMLGFLRHPLPENATQHDCGFNRNGIGGDFVVWNGTMWRSHREFKPEGTNRKCDRIGQTAAIRVNMRTREARLFVDDEEQPGIFTDIPSPLCLAITTGGRIKSVEVLWLKRRRESDELERAALEERRIQKSQINEMKQHFADHSIWFGTEALQTLDRTAHTLTPTTLTQIINLEQGVTWRTAFTRRIDEGEWELKIRASEHTFHLVMLGFLQHPLPEDATQETCGSWTNGFGGEFTLWDGRMWTNDEEFKPEGTNKICDRIGDIAAIRVNMRTREARLFVDDEEQSGIFTDIPSPLCLGITTGFRVENQSVEVKWLKRL
ncbi:putative Aurora kinase [Blattamonas nauphoetae]|uniref:Aurora kinase n=1 Tax=Blattamonas nauphoetae TaxID=2049346 RepID=A0ABQ9X7L5_9EUKA|nr:putative Aurora kinase [Blattamonas nauphoetae]